MPAIFRSIRWPAPLSARSRLSAAGIHLLLSLTVAVAAASLVFGVWYPYPYREISGGRQLFFIVVIVDVVMGPLLTLTVFNPEKPVKVLLRDLSVIGLLQLTALAYGLWTVSAARPVHLVFEFSRFHVVHAIDVPEKELPQAEPEYRHLPWSGPTLLSMRTFDSDKEKFDLSMDEVQGLLLSARPRLWQSFEKARTQVLQAAKPLTELKRRFPDQVGLINTSLEAAMTGRSLDHPLGYLPLIAGDKFWTVLIDLNTIEVIAFVPIDSF